MLPTNIKKSLFIVLALCLSNASFAYTDFNKIEFKFLSNFEASQFLSTPDDFINNLTQLDLSLHHSTPKTISKEEQLEFLKHVALDWNPEEIERLKAKIEIMEKAINSLDLNINFPSVIRLIKTTGEDEFYAHYTRGNAIIFPIKSSAEGVTTDAGVVFHEFFHIMSRYNPNLTNELYSICNFKPIKKVTIPESISDISLTNPDAFYYEHSVVVNAGGKEINVIPFFYSALKQSEISGPVNEATTFKLGLLDLETLSDKFPKIYKTSETDYKARVSANSTYYIHPEEIMAENFRLLLSKEAMINPMPSIKYPAVLEELKLLLKK